jgi:hypothetical protein
MLGDIRTLEDLKERYPIEFVYEDKFGGKHYLAKAYNRVLVFYEFNNSGKLKPVGDFAYIGFAILTILEAEADYEKYLLSQDRVTEAYARLSINSFNEICERLKLSRNETKASPNYNDLLVSSSVSIKAIKGVDRTAEAIDQLLEKLVFRLGLVLPEALIDFSQDEINGEKKVKLEKWYEEYPKRKRCPKCRSHNINFELTNLEFYLHCLNCHYEANAHSTINGGIVGDCWDDRSDFRNSKFVLYNYIKEKNKSLED